MPKDREHGEGSYKGTAEYNERTRKFMEKTDEERLAREAAPKDREEAERLKKAEMAGESRARDEDPALYDPSIARKAEEKEKKSRGK